MWSVGFKNISAPEVLEEFVNLYGAQDASSDTEIWKKQKLKINILIYKGRLSDAFHTWCLGAGGFGVCGWWWWVGGVVNLAQRSQISVQEQAYAIKAQSSVLSFFLYFLFVSFYDPLSCTWSLFIRRRRRSEAAHIHIHMYKEKIRPNSASFLSAEPERHDEGGRKEQLKGLWWFLLLKGERQSGERKQRPLCFSEVLIHNWILLMHSWDSFSCLSLHSNSVFVAF